MSAELTARPAPYCILNIVSLSVESTEAGSTAVVSVRGSATLGPALIQFAARARSVLDSAPAALVLDVSGVESIDSAGLGEIIKIYSSAARRGIAFAMAGATPRVREVMAMTHLDEVLTCYPDRSLAMAALNQRA